MSLPGIIVRLLNEDTSRPLWLMAIAIHIPGVHFKESNVVFSSKLIKVLLRFFVKLPFNVFDNLDGNRKYGKGLRCHQVV